jgi:hypothetical protein
VRGSARGSGPGCRLLAASTPYYALPRRRAPAGSLAPSEVIRARAQSAAGTGPPGAPGGRALEIVEKVVTTSDNIRCPITLSDHIARSHRPDQGLIKARSRQSRWQARWHGAQTRDGQMGRWARGEGAGEAQVKAKMARQDGEAVPGSIAGSHRGLGTLRLGCSAQLGTS